MDELQKIEVWIQSFDFSRWQVGEEDVDDEQIRWLDARDSPSFDAQWMRVFNFVETQEEGNPPTPEEKQKIAGIRRNVYSAASKWAFVNELAAYAADDFELIARAARMGLTDFWLDKLRGEYEAGRFPHGAL